METIFDMHLNQRLNSLNRTMQYGNYGNRCINSQIAIRLNRTMQYGNIGYYRATK